jgi:Family of unknown function (DUF6069)
MTSQVSASRRPTNGPRSPPRISSAADVEIGVPAPTYRQGTTSPKEASMSTTTTTTRVRPTRSVPVPLVGLAAGVAASVATELYGLVARAAGVPMAAAGLGSQHAQPVTLGMFAMGTIICTFWGTVLAVILNRYAARPARTFTVTALGLTAVSLIAPLTAADTAGWTKATLAVAHLLAASIVIPLLAHRLRHIRARA